MNTDIVIHNPYESHNILSMFPRFLDKTWYVLSFVWNFAAVVHNVIILKMYVNGSVVVREAESLTNTTVLQSLLRSARNQTDQSSDYQPGNSILFIRSFTILSVLTQTKGKCLRGEKRRTQPVLTFFVWLLSEWDSDMACFLLLLLLHILPSQPAKTKTQISAA